MEQEKKIETADHIWLNTKPHMQQIGGDTNISTIAYMAAVSKIALKYDPKVLKLGDQIKWEASLEGLITIDQHMLDDAINQMFR